MKYMLVSYGGSQEDWEGLAAWSDEDMHRLEEQGWLKAKTGTTETGREAKFYALTPAGRRQLARELETWDRLSGAIGLVVRDGEA